MKALRFIAGRLAVDDRPNPEAGTEALVRVILSGICNTDLEIARGYAGFEGTLGHEFVGVVENADGCADLVGKRVVGEINAGCGLCDKCVAGDPRHCAGRTVLGIVGRDGAHAEMLRLPHENLIVVPDSISDRDAVFAEPLAAAMAITEQVDVAPDTRVAVVGDGKLGLLCAMTLALSSSDVVLIGKHRYKMAIAANAGVGSSRLSEIRANMKKSFDVVVEASGSVSGFVTAVDLVRPRGKIVLKSTFHGSPEWPASRIVVDEITVVGSRCGRLQTAVDALAAGLIDVGPMVSDEFPLADGIEAMARAAEPGVLKVLLRP